MNRKILLIATLVVLTIISIGSISAEEIDDEIVSDDVGEIELGDVELPTLIHIEEGMTNEQIQNKINENIKDGATISFEPGEYNDISLIIGNATGTRLSNIKIEGNGATLKGNPKPNAASNASDQADLRNYVGIFEVQGIDGFTLTGFNFIAEGVSGATPKTPSCVIIYATSNGVIENNNISGGRFGLYVGNKFQNGNDLTSNFNTIIRNNTVSGVTDMGIINFGSPKSQIVNNTILNPANHGIDVRFQKSQNVTVEGNKVIGAKEGIYLMHSSGHIAQYNQLINCSEGIVCYGSSNIKIDYNNFTNTKIRILLSSGYKNINIGENNDYGVKIEPDKDVPFPPTFAYFIVRGDEDWVRSTSGVFSDADYIITPVATAITAADMTATAKIAKNLAVTLKDAAGKVLGNKVVTYSVNGVTKTAKTNSNGVVQIAVNQVAGTYYYALTFLGDDNYKGTFKTVKVTVNKQAVKATFAKATLKAKVAKKVKFTLKDASGKAIAGKKITVKVNGKTFSAKTNSKGVAYIKVKVTKKGKFTATAKFAGDNVYKAITKKATFTVKA